MQCVPWSARRNVTLRARARGGGYRGTDAMDAEQETTWARERVSESREGRSGRERPSEERNISGSEDRGVLVHQGQDLRLEPIEQLRVMRFHCRARPRQHAQRRCIPLHPCHRPFGAASVSSLHVDACRGSLPSASAIIFKKRKEHRAMPTGKSRIEGPLSIVRQKASCASVCPSVC